MNNKAIIYDELSRLLTNYEEGTATKEELYNVLVKIQNNWESVITVQE